MVTNTAKIDELEKRGMVLEKRIKCLEEEVAALKGKLAVIENQKPVNVVLYQSALRAQAVGNIKPLEEYLKHYSVPT